MQDYQLNISHMLLIIPCIISTLAKIDGGWDLYGKLVSGSRKYLKSNNASQLRDGYFIGTPKDQQSYIIVINISDIKPPKPQDKEFGGPWRKQRASKLFNNYN